MASEDSRFFKHRSDHERLGILKFPSLSTQPRHVVTHVIEERIQPG